MPVLAFLVTVAYLPYVGPMAATPRWALLSVALPFLLLWRPARMSLPLGLLVAFLAYNALSLTWAWSFWDGLERIWRYSIFIMAFAIGTTLIEHRFRRFWYGAAAGLLVSSVLVTFQVAGFEGVSQAAAPAGLFMNRNYLAETALIVIAGLMPNWLVVVPLLPALILPASRGAFVAAYLVLLMALWYRSRVNAIAIVAAAVLAGGAWFAVQGIDDRGRALTNPTTVTARISYWANSVGMIAARPWGQGAGSFWAAYPFYNDRILPTDAAQAYTERNRPRTAHNDFLTVAAESGAFALVLFYVLGFAAYHGQGPARYGLLAFLLLGVTGFPLFNPETAFLGAVCAGHLLRRRGGLLLLGPRWRNLLVRRRGRA